MPNAAAPDSVRINSLRFAIQSLAQKAFWHFRGELS
jgi:hypothetical protein